MELGGVRQWVRIDGTSCDTVPLVVLHGGPGGNHWVFERTAGQRLALERTVIYHEQRGCGRSESPTDPNAYSLPTLIQDLAQLVSWLGVPTVDLLGYSFGGGLALEMARTQPHLVRRVIAQAPVMDVWHPEVVAHQIAGFNKVMQGKRSAQLDRFPGRSAVEQLEAIWVAADTSTVNRFLFQDLEYALQNRAWWDESGLINTGEMARALAGMAPDLDDIGVSVKAPVLLLIGLHDRNVPLTLVKRLATTLPDARLVLFEHSAHFPDIEETEHYAHVVLKFLAQAL